MIVTVHFIGIIIFQILRNRKRLKFATVDLCKERDLENQLKFDPPLFRQRYGRVSQILVREEWRTLLKKLVDFGCGEFGLFMYLKKLSLEEVLFVDIDECVLAENLFRIEPLLIDCVRRRCTPLEVSVYRGSVIDPDYRLRKTDVVTAIELIEHLYPDTLDAFPYNVFHFIKPKLVIITTPNADFNIAFGRHEGFRHPDHKFEWNSEQFAEWGTNITQRFPDYTVEFQGIGEGPERLAHLGCCSQVAIFIRKDVVSDSYTFSDCVKSCQCETTSPCKGQTVECKLQCTCLCALCLPDVSVGVCTYLSRNISDSEAYRSMKTCPKKSQSSTKVNFSSADLVLRSDSAVVNKSYNIFYKLIGSVNYLYQVDDRSDKERVLETLKYRIRTFSSISSRFFVEERERCEIPVQDLVYGDVELSLNEVCHILSESGYQVEQCLIQESEQFEQCVISMPQEMEDITSSSEVTDGYSSKSSECNESSNLEPHIEPMSDWDDCPPLSNMQADQAGGTSSATVKPPADPLFDSGYLKSPSPLEIAGLLPQEQDLSDLDLFEDTVPTPSMRSDDNKLHLKKAKASSLSENGVTSNRPKVLDLNRVNELDRFRNVNAAKTFLRPLNESKRSPPKDFPVAGTSTSWKKYHRKGKITPDKIRKSPNKEPTPLEDVKSLTNCIVQNSLNKIEVEPLPVRSPVLIKDFVEQDGDVVDAPFREAILPAIPLPPPPPRQEVENGDLANNNRDNEGNNLPENEAIEQEDVDEGIDLLNDNLEDLLPVLADNVAVVENNNDLRVDQEQPNQPLPEMGEDRNDADDLEQEDDSSIAKASREALYDISSEQDLLEDFDIPPQADVNSPLLYDALGLGGANVVLVGIQPIGSGNQIATTASIQTNRNSFPDWLLQILGTQVATEQASRSPSNGHDEPHFYCQGDGLGVHPSVIAVEVDDADDADNDTSSEETSSNNTVDYADAEPGPSDMQDMSSLPEELSEQETASSLSTDRHADPESATENATSTGAILVDGIIRAAQTEIAERNSITALSSDNTDSAETSNGSTASKEATVENSGECEPQRNIASTSGNESRHVVEAVDSVDDSHSLTEKL